MLGAALFAFDLLYSKTSKTILIRMVVGGFSYNARIPGFQLVSYTLSIEAHCNPCRMPAIIEPSGSGSPRTTFLRPGLVREAGILLRLLSKQS